MLKLFRSAVLKANRILPNQALRTVLSTGPPSTVSYCQTVARRFNTSGSIGASIWSSKDNGPTLAVLGAVAILSPLILERVPGSRRWRFNFVSKGMEKQLIQRETSQILEQYKGKIVRDESSEAELVRRVLFRLLDHAGGPKQKPMKALIVNDDSAQATVVGDTIFVHRGMLRVTQSEEGLAAVLSHEIAHNVANTSGENSSLAVAILPIFMLLELPLLLYPKSRNIYAPMLFRLLVALPASRRQELEADRIALRILSRSSYRPQAAIEFLNRLREAEMEENRRKGYYESAPPWFLSTHPEIPDRIRRLEEQFQEDSGLAGNEEYEASA